MALLCPELGRTGHNLKWMRGWILMVEQSKDSTSPRTPASARNDICFEEFVRELEPRVRSFAMASCRDRNLVDEAVQESFLVAWRRFDSISADVAPDHYFAYMCGVLARSILNIERRERRHLRKIEAAGPSVRRSAGLLTDIESRELLEKAIRRMRPIDRLTVLLTVWNDAPVSVIAALRRSSEEAARRQVQRLLERIRIEMRTQDAG